MSEKPGVFLPALYGGIIIAFISSVPILNFINVCCCAGVLLGGFLSVFFYRKELTPQTPLTSADCMQLGALAGLFGAILGSLVFVLKFYAFGEINEILKNLEQLEGRMSSAQYDAIISFIQSGALFVVVVVAASILIDTLFGLLGGLIAYSTFKPKNVPPAAPTGS
jgi:hypothetical protein